MISDTAGTAWTNNAGERVLLGDGIADLPDDVSADALSVCMPSNVNDLLCQLPDEQRIHPSFSWAGRWLLPWPEGLDGDGERGGQPGPGGRAAAKVQPDGLDVVGRERDPEIVLLAVLRDANPSLIGPRCRCGAGRENVAAQQNYLAGPHWWRWLLVGEIHPRKDCGPLHGGGASGLPISPGRCQLQRVDWWRRRQQQGRRAGDGGRDRRELHCVRDGSRGRQHGRLGQVLPILRQGGALRQRWTKQPDVLAAMVSGACQPWPWPGAIRNMGASVVASLDPAVVIGDDY